MDHLRKANTQSQLTISLFYEPTFLPYFHYILIRFSDNDSTSLWPPGSLHTLGADGHI